MKIATVSKSDATGGGASTVAEYIATGLQARQHASMHYCLYADKGFNHHRRPIGGHNVWQMMKYNLFLKNSNGFSNLLPIEAPFFDEELERFSFDLFHFHDLSSAVSPLTLLRLSQSVPVFWTLHDCSAFTGGCLYPMECTKYLDETECHDCPQHGRWPLDTRYDTAWIGLEERRRLHASENLHLVSPSRWLADTAHETGLPLHEVAVIPNGIPDEPFEGLDRAAVRADLGISETALVFCFSSGHLEDERKNIADAIAAIRATGATRDEVAIIVLGNMNDAVEKELEGLTVIAPGFVREKRTLAGYLAASDAFVFTSLAENHPLSVLEAMAAGTAILGYDTGGVKEQVVDGETGRLVPSGDKDALIALFSDLPDADRLREMGRAGRARFEAEFTLDTMLERYIAHFTRMAGEEGA